MKKTLKILVALMLVLVLSFALVACKKDDRSKAEKNIEKVQQASAKTIENCSATITVKSSGTDMETLNQTMNMKMDGKNLYMSVPMDGSATPMEVYVVDGFVYEGTAGSFTKTPAEESDMGMVSNVTIPEEQATALSLQMLKSLEKFEGCSYTLTDTKFEVVIDLAQVLTNLQNAIAGSDKEKANDTFGKIYKHIMGVDVNFAKVLREFGGKFTAETTLGDVFDLLKEDFNIDIETYLTIMKGIISALAESGMVPAESVMMFAAFSPSTKLIDLLAQPQVDQNGNVIEVDPTQVIAQMKGTIEGFATYLEGYTFFQLLDMLAGYKVSSDDFFVILKAKALTFTSFKTSSGVEINKKGYLESMSLKLDINVSLNTKALPSNFAVDFNNMKMNVDVAVEFSGFGKATITAPKVTA